MVGLKKIICLVNVYSLHFDSFLDKRVPLGMLFLGNSLKQAGYEVVVYHMAESKMESTIEDIDFSKFLFVGVCSILTGHSMREAMKLSKSIKNKSSVPVVWGGVQPSITPELCLQEPYVDFVARGYGEETIVEIARMFEGEIAPADVEGLAYKTPSGEFVIGEMRKLKKNLDCYHADYELIDLKDYIFGGMILGLMMTSRGCPFNCAFCYNQFFSGRVWQKHSFEYISRVLSSLRQKYSFSVLSFSDDNFFVDNQRAIDILEDTNKLKIKVDSLGIKINNITDDDILKMNEYGVRSVYFGTESLNVDICKAINKEQSKEMVVEIIKKFSILAPGINVQTNIMMGFPGESMDEIRKDVADGLELIQYNPNFSIAFVNLIPLPGTEMYDLAVGENRGFNPTQIEDFTEIDIRTVAQQIDKWAKLDSPSQDKRILGYILRYSAFLSIDRRNIGTLKQFVKYMFFKIAYYRLKNWNFTLSSFDLYLYGICEKIANSVRKFQAR